MQMVYSSLIFGGNKIQNGVPLKLHVTWIMQRKCWKRT